MRRIFLRLLILLNLILVLLLILNYISVFIPPDSFWISSIFGLLYPVLFWLNLCFVIFWAFIKPKYLLISLLFLILGFGYFKKYVQFHHHIKTEIPGIKVLSYNVRHFEEFGNKQAKETADSVIAYMEQKKPDIICFQESRLWPNSIFNIPELVNKFEFINHYQFARNGYSMGMVTMTKYPIINMGEIRFEYSGNMAIFTDVVIDSDTLRIFNLHLQSFQINPNDYSVIESRSIETSEDINEVREMGGKFKRASKMRAQQARIIRENIDWSPYPVLVCGDFNDTPFSYTYRKVKGNLFDAFVESGKGFGQTYIGKLPSYRIDFILHSDKYKSVNFEEGDVHYSDHLPVRCILKKN
ncbi:MAG: endonuclease/exonuclease/phosphatase family protein [Prolixibacteraceae bacterium]|nr:endonuclease/exonuclease/phosphatase family protein [Prolixibacteraceae bacterium]